MHLLRMHFIQLWINDMSGPFELRQRKEKTRSVGALSGKEVTTERGVGWENKRQKPSFKWQCVRKLNDPKKGPVTQRGPSHTTHAPDIVLMHFPSTDTAARIWSLLIHHTINCQQAGQNDQRRMWCLTLAGHKLFFHILVSVLLLYIKKKKHFSFERITEMERKRKIYTWFTSQTTTMPRERPGASSTFPWATGAQALLSEAHHQRAGLKVE